MRYMVLALVTSMLACGNPLDVTVIAVDVVGDVVVSPDDPGQFQVTVANTSDERVVWGMGSSSCQLTLGVIVDSERRSIDFRSCTEDLAEQGLDPGERRTETFEWGGEISVGGVLEPLPDGEYQVIGVVGDLERSAPLVVTVSS